MKRAGTRGGMSPESTVAFHECSMRTYKQRQGDYGYAETPIHSASSQPYVDWPAQGREDLTGAGLATAATDLEKAGAGFVSAVDGAA